MLSPFTNMSKDILSIVLSYLTPEEVAYFKQVCRLHNNQLKTPELDVLWQPVLNRLRAMDASVPMMGPEMTAWRYPLINQYFLKINKEQEERIVSYVVSLTKDDSEVKRKKKK